MKIIDFEKKGNVVRFYLGDDDCTDYWGDDWDDLPYDCNADRVYDRFVKGIHDVSFPFDYKVLEPGDGCLSCNYSKEDIKNRITPCIIAVPPQLVKGGWYDNDFSYWVGADGVQRFYFEDKMEAQNGL